MRIFLIVLGALVLCACVAIATVALYVYLKYKPYLTYPDVDEAYLDAQLTAYRALWDAKTDRHGDDTEQLASLVESYRELAQQDFEYPTCWCDTDAAEAIAVVKQRLVDLEPLFARLAIVVEDGLVVSMADAYALQTQNREPLSLPFILSMNRIVLAEAVTRSRRGENEAAVKRLEAIRRMIEGFRDCPTLLYTLLAARMEKDFHRTLIYLAPVLDASNLLAMAKALEKNRKPAVTSTLEGLMAEAVFGAKVLDRPAADLEKELPGKLPTGLIKSNWFVRKEYYNLLDMSVGRVEAYRAYLEGKTKSPVVDEPQKGKSRGFLASIMAVSLSPIHNAAVNQDRESRAVVEALQRTVARRAKMGTEPLEVLLEGKSRIVVGPDVGCVVELEGAVPQPGP